MRDAPGKPALLPGEPKLFFTTPGYDGSPLVMLRLAEVDVERLGELLTDAWRMRAPQALVGEPRVVVKHPRAGGLRHCPAS